MDAYESARDFRLNGSASAAHYFPSRNATYCEPTDATCSECAHASFAVSDSGRVHESQFCVGAGGCVCVGFCELPDYADLVQSRMCDAPAGVESSGSDAWSNKSMHMMASAIVLSALVLVSLSLWLWRRGKRRNITHSLAMKEGVDSVLRRCADTARAEARARATDRSREPRSPQFGPLLELTAWKARRDELIARETAEKLGAPSYDSSCCFYLTPPTSTAVAVMADEDARDSVGSMGPSCGLYGHEHEREGGGAGIREPHDDPNRSGGHARQE